MLPPQQAMPRQLGPRTADTPDPSLPPLTGCVLEGNLTHTCLALAALTQKGVTVWQIPSLSLLQQ